MLAFTLVLILLLVGVFFFQPQPLLRFLARLNPDVLFYIETERKLIALTIDDGPHQTVTLQILDALKEYDVHATFFILGENVNGNEDLIGAIVQGGHEVGNHMVRDFPSILLSADRFRSELMAADRLLSSHEPVKWYRPGSGWFNRRMLDQVHEMGYKLCLGSLYPHDTKLRNVALISQYILLRAFPGAILILHDGSPDRIRTVRVLEKVLPELQRRGYEIVTLSELVAESAKGP